MPTAVSKLKVAPPAQSLSVDNPAVADVTLDSFLLDGRPMDAELVDAVDDAGINRAIDGASTLTASIADPKRELLRSPILAKAADLWIDDLAFRLAGIDYDEEEGPHLDLTFEARAVARLRLFDDPKAASRAHVNRAQFIKSLCDEAGVPFVCPQLHRRQKIQKPQDALTQRQKDRERHPGIKATAALTVKAKPADSEQRKNMERVLDVARSHNAGDRASLALIEACIQESLFRNLAHGDSTSTGILQLLAATAAGLRISARDVEACAAAFLTRGFFGQGGAMDLARKHPDWTPGQIAQVVQGSQFPNAYEVWRDEADKILAAYSGGEVGADDAPDTYPVAYMFRRGTEDGQKEDSWTCMRRLADEVNWRLWEDAGTVYFMTDTDILRSRVRHTITPGAEGIDKVSFRLDVRKPVQEVTVECQARRWQAPPATVAELEGYGPKADGRWIVATINRPSIFATATTVTLHRRQKAKLEPAHELRSRAGTADSGVELVGNGVAGGTLRARVVAAAKHAADLSKGDPAYYHYSQTGAWKNDLFRRDAPGERSDCSSFVIQCYVKAGCKLPASMHHQGFTGTLADEGHKVSSPKPGDVVLYGTYPFHHVELYVGGGQTIGHGSRFVDTDTPRNPALGTFAGYWTFDFLDADQQPSTTPSTGHIPGIGNVGAD